jgi:hypothetical protein
MSGSEERMRALVTGYRRAIAPAMVDRARIWNRLELDESPTVRPAGRVAIVVGVVVAAAAGVLLFAMRPSAQRSAEVRDRDASQSVDEVPERAVDSAPQREPPAPAIAAPPLPAVVPVPESPPATLRKPRVPPTRAAAPAEDPLRAELRLIEAAREALERGDYDATLARIGEHRRRFPDGELVLEARSIRALALCGAGRWMQGRGEARSLLQESTSSPYRDRLREACDVQ